MHLPALPEGAVALHSDGALLAVREDYVARFREWRIEARKGEPFETTELTGRRALASVKGSDGAVLVRRFSHGGLLAPLTGRRFASPDRPFAEWRLAERLRALGLPTPAVVAARARPLTGFGWTLELFVERVEGSQDLGATIDQRRSGRLDDAAWRQVIERFGSLIGRAHFAGFLHADLHPKNVLVDADGTLLFVDLDRSRIENPLDEKKRLVNLARLWRWVEREDRRAPFLSRTDVWRFLSRWSAEAGGSSVREAFEAIARHTRKNRVWHRAGRTLQGR